MKGEKMKLKLSKNKIKETKAKYFSRQGMKGHLFHFLAVISPFLCCLLLFYSTAVSQTIKGSYSFDRSPDQVKHLLSLLSYDDKLKEVPQCFFGKDVVYDKELADLLVFIDKTGRNTADNTNNDEEAKSECLSQDKSVKFALLKCGKKREELFGAKFIYIMVFVAENYNEQNSVGKFTKDIETTEKVVEESGGNASGKTEEKVIEMLRGDASGKTGEIIIEKPVGDTSGKTDEVTKTIKYREPLSVFQSSLDSRPSSGEFVLYSVIRSIANTFSGVAIEKADKSQITSDIVNVPIRMFLVGSDNDTKTNLYFGFMKTALSENTINRFTVQEEYGNNEDPHQNKKYVHLATFGNYGN
jgi:hypothetical protein